MGTGGLHPAPTEHFTYAKGGLAVAFLRHRPFASLEVILGIISWLLLKGFVIFLFLLSVKQNALNILFCLFNGVLIY